MYEAQFQMHRRPFPPSVDVSTYVGVGPVEQAGQTLLRVVQRSSGPALVIGAAGSGKSMLCQLLAEHFEEELHVALLANGQLANAKSLFQAILFELGLPYRDMDENELRLGLVEFLTDPGRCPHGLLLIVDEAHNLPLRVLEEIRMLTNVVLQGQARVRLVLAGGAALEERFTSPKLDSFNQRLAARCYLEHLNREETKAYIKEQVVAAGGKAEATFTEDALNAVFDATDGIPRLVNQLCDHALIMTALGGHATVNADVIQEAWADLQQLPTPCLDTTAGHSAAGTQHVIEFGELDDEEGEPASIPFAPRQKVAASEPREEITQPAAESRLAEIESHIATVAQSFDEIPSLEQQEIASQEAAQEELPPTAPEPVMAPNPFEESFEEETTVLDQFASLHETRLVNAPRVRSVEGQQIGKLLAGVTTSPHDVQGEAFVPTITVTETDDVEQNELDDQQAEGVRIGKVHVADEQETHNVAKVQADVASHIQYPAAYESFPAIDTANLPQEVEDDLVAAQQQLELTEAVSSMLQESEQDMSLDELDVVYTTSPAAGSPVQLSLINAQPAETCSEETGDAQSDEITASYLAPEDDRDLIIVEPREEVAGPTQEAQGSARRQKYRQLFQRLRQA